MKMKKYLIKISIWIILFILIIGTPYSNAKKEDTTSIHLDITSNEFVDEFNPNKDKNTDKQVDAIATPISESIIKIANIVLGVVQLLGGILAVISIAIYGFGMVISTHGPLAHDLGFGGGPGIFGGFMKTPDAKMSLLNFGRSLLIGSVLLFCSVTLVKFVLNVMISA